MERRISEADWKRFRRLQPVALERFCHGVLSEVGGIASDNTKGSHKRYLEVFKLMRERDDELGAAFNDTRRSTAFVQLARMQSLGLLTDEELAGFSAETRGAVALFLEMWSA
jgi:hypothetical protein